MRVFVSDLHLGDRGPRDNFAPNESAFLSFLDWVDSQKAQLYILGDLWDGWQCNLSRIFVAYRDLLRRMHSMDATHIVGNHDAQLAAFANGPTLRMSLGVVLSAMVNPGELMLNGDRKLCVCHGHEADDYCRSPNPGFGEVTAIISGMMEDRASGVGGNGEIEDQFISSLELLPNAWKRLRGEPSRLQEMIAGVDAMRIQHGCAVSLSGHTHVPGRVGETYYNTGCWCRTKNTFAIEDCGTIHVMEWKVDHAEPYDAELVT